ncbi:MAG: hypothetical protein KIT56_10890 [Gammaproteobacteria bacterium]|nr:hypothetical protein [Gammaproteobacteria bacterium]MCW5584351.1 hypothetical protein [Gammaproteobacteria bacterium]
MPTFNFLSPDDLEKNLAELIEKVSSKHEEDKSQLTGRREVQVNLLGKVNDLLKIIMIPPDKNKQKAQNANKLIQYGEELQKFNEIEASTKLSEAQLELKKKISAEKNALIKFMNSFPDNEEELFQEQERLSPEQEEKIKKKITADEQRSEAITGLLFSIKDEIEDQYKKNITSLAGATNALISLWKPNNPKNSALYSGIDEAIGLVLPKVPGAAPVKPEKPTSKDEKILKEYEEKMISYQRELAEHEKTVEKYNKALKKYSSPRPIEPIVPEKPTSRDKEVLEDYKKQMEEYQLKLKNFKQALEEYNKELEVFKKKAITKYNELILIPSSIKSNKIEEVEDKNIKATISAKHKLKKATTVEKNAPLTLEDSTNTTLLLPNPKLVALAKDAYLPEKKRKMIAAQLAKYTPTPEIGRYVRDIKSEKIHSFITEDNKFREKLGENHTDVNETPEYRGKDAREARPDERMQCDYEAIIPDPKDAQKANVKWKVKYNTQDVQKVKAAWKGVKEPSDKILDNITHDMQQEFLDYHNRRGEKKETLVDHSIKKYEAISLFHKNTKLLIESDPKKLLKHVETKETTVVQVPDDYDVKQRFSFRK